MQPLAIGVIGGFLLSGPIVLLVLPALYRSLDPKVAWERGAIHPPELENRVNPRSPAALAALLTLGVARATAAQQPARPDTRHKRATPTYGRQVPANLAAQAKISEDSARAVALARVPGGTIHALELERERGTLIYSWEIQVVQKPGITEVNVSAIDGHVVSVEHEGRAAHTGRIPDRRAKPPGRMRCAARRPRDAYHGPPGIV